MKHNVRIINNITLSWRDELLRVDYSAVFCDICGVPRILRRLK